MAGLTAAITGAAWRQRIVDELEAEQQRRQRDPAPDSRRPPPPPVTSDVFDVPMDEAVAEETGRSVLVNFDQGDLERLQRLGQKRGQSAEQMIREMVSNLLRFAD